jgi:phosphopantothenoylcysteine decarboxylase/phosphopantothenate--cysteine ligase
MRCVVTAGPTYEPLDDVRRLTNFSSGRLGSELANFLEAQGHETTLLLGEQATFRGERRTHRIETFTTTANLRDRLRALSEKSVDAVFHAAAVSDFAFGRIWIGSPGGPLTQVKSGKFSTRQGTLLAELVPTLKIIAELRQWYPGALLIGWKYEVEGDQASVLQLAEKQMAECRTDACVVNGPAYGRGFGIVRRECAFTPVSDRTALYVALERLIRE